MIQDITKKIDNNYILWFEKSNQWVQLQEPAWFVNKLLKQGGDINSISVKCAKKYKRNINECRSFVNEICRSIEELSKPYQVVTDNFNFSFLPSQHTFIPFTTRKYLIGNKNITIIYDSRIAEFNIHPPLAHLEIFSSATSDIQFEIFSIDNIPVLREKENPNSTFVLEDFMTLKKQLYIQLVNLMYKKNSTDWMSFIHASALTNGKKTVLLSSASGSGKSTMAALMQTRGLQMVSDDFVPIDAKTKRAFHFPAAISVKKGAFDLLSPYYGNLQDIKFNSYEYTHKSIRYLPPISTTQANLKSTPVKSIIFIHYNPLVTCNFKLVPATDALKIFHEQAWVSANPKHAKTFINWFVNLNCFHLEYGNTQNGIDKVVEIFNN